MGAGWIRPEVDGSLGTVLTPQLMAAPQSGRRAILMKSVSVMPHGVLLLVLFTGCTLSFDEFSADPTDPDTGVSQVDRGGGYGG